MRADLVSAAESFAPRIREVADEVEREARLPEDLVEQMTEAGLFRLYMPASAGGEEADPLTVFAVIEALAQADASVAWILMIAAEIASSVGWLDPAVASEVLGRDASGRCAARMSGSARPNGVAVVAEGGYVVDGRWDFASGIEQATAMVGMCSLQKPDGSPLLHEGTPEYRMMLMPVGDGRIDRTWNTMGLRGTGSHDFVASGVFVPGERALDLMRPALSSGPLWTPGFHLVGNWVANAGQAIGTARGAITEFRELATTTGSSGSRTLLRERDEVRLELARAEAKVSAARAFVQEAVGAAWTSVVSGEADRGLIARARLANVHAVHESVGAIDLLYHAAGTNAIHKRTGLERRFRDIHVAVQHGAGLDWNYDVAAREMLGMEPRLRR